MNKKYYVLIILCILVTIALVLVPNHTRYAQSIYSSTISPTKEEVPQPIQMIFFGDGMFDRGVKNSVKKNFNDDFNKLFVNLPEIQDYDIAFLNLEGPVSENGKNVGSKYSFRFEPRVLSALHAAGFDIVSSANNHMGDWTLTAFKDTLAHLSNTSILYTGAGMTKQLAQTPTIIDVRGTKIGFIGFTDVGPNWLEATETRAGILLASDPDFSTIISNARAQVDFLIVSIHWGEEYSPHNSRQTTLAHNAIDAGADAIIGHHPHVEQATEWYKDKFIAYSLGNFIFDQYFSPETMTGLSVVLSYSPEDKTLSVKTFDTPLSSQFQPLGLVERK